MERKASVSRTTKETDITVSVDLDGTGQSSIQTGNGFFDHMMVLFTRHGLFDISIACAGDTHIDFHHSVEDIGICLGQAFAQALGNGAGIIRYGTAYLPMDESLARVCCDICGRSNLVYHVALTDRKISDFDCDLAEDFLKAFSDNARITLHVDLLRGRNSHHSLEAVFKGFARALSCAVSINPRGATAIPSTKGLLL